MLKGKQKRFLRALGVNLNPVVQVGKAGVVETLTAETQDALRAHELIKVRVMQNCPEETKDVAEELAKHSESQLVQIVGRNILLYKRSDEKPKIELPE